VSLSVSIFPFNHREGILITEKRMSRTIKNHTLWAKTPHKPQRRPANAENQADLCLVKEKIMKNNRPTTQYPSRVHGMR